jgi:hypothetical protein
VDSPVDKYVHDEPVDKSPLIPQLIHSFCTILHTLINRLKLIPLRVSTPISTYPQALLLILLFLNKSLKEVEIKLIDYVSTSSVRRHAAPVRTVITKWHPRAQDQLAKKGM